MKKFVSILSLIVSLVVIVGGATFGVFEAYRTAMPLLLHISNTMGTVEAAGIVFAGLVHVALALSVLMSMPFPGNWKASHIAKALALGVSGLLILALGVPFYVFQAPDNPVVAIVEMMSGMYGLMFGGFVTLIALMTIPINHLDTALKKISDFSGGIAYDLRQRLSSQT